MRRPMAMAFSWGRTRQGDEERIHVMSNYDAEHFTFDLDRDLGSGLLERIRD
jgi:hypothetical protein